MIPANSARVPPALVEYIRVNFQTTLYILRHRSIGSISLSAPGETVEIAEEMAARDALRRIFRTDDARPMLPMGDQASWEQVYPRGCVKLRSRVPPPDGLLFPPT